MNAKQHTDMQTPKLLKRKLRKWVWLPISALVVSLTWSLAHAGPFHGRHGGGHPFEHLLDHIDLSDSQSEQIEAILSRNEGKEKGKHRFDMMKEFAAMDPEDPDYLTKVEQKADEAAEKMKAHLVDMAKTRQEIYAILDAEQKQELDEVIERKMKRMAKHRK